MKEIFIMDTKSRIKSIRIEKLFEIFDYDIQYPTNENVLIITGPNGFGKTQVLNILYSLFNRKFMFFQTLIFEKITVYLNNNISIEIHKNINEEKEVILTILKEETEIDKFQYSIDKKMMRDITRHLPISWIEEDKWLDRMSEEILSIDEIILRYEDSLPSEISNKILNFNSEEANSILDSINVHLIREQRLFKKASVRERNYRNESNQMVMIETIQTYSDELKNLISERIQKSFAISQSLDRTYPKRLISGKKRVSKKEYDQKFADLTNKQDRLMKNGLHEETQQTLEYSEDDAKALLVYLNDLEQKLEIFDDLLEKLELFSNILNERRFTFKSIHISRDKGFYFKTTKGKELKLSQLSSGEQHEVILLYELIFKTSADILVLIDEPEISLHITWQKEFLDDLLKIIKMQNFQVLIATHSPSIINGRWDLVYNLEKKDGNE